MKEPREWDEEYLLSLPPGEHNWLEMKGRRTVDLTASGVVESKVRDDLSKAISALANSGGGVLVLGLKEIPGGWAVDDGGVALSVKGKMSTREWLEDVIPNLVEERLVDFNVYMIARSAESSQIEGGRGVFIVEVGDSEQAPHQASDNKYYARVGGKSRPIGHRLVMDIFNRRRHPKMEMTLEFMIVTKWKPSVEGVFGIGSYGSGGKRERETEEVLEAHFRLTNIGRVLVNYMQCSVWIPKGLFLQSFLSLSKDPIVKVEDVEYVVWGTSNIERDLIKHGPTPFSETEYGASWYRRILPSRSHTWDVGFLRAEMLNSYANNEILWELVADNAPVEKGRFRIGDIRPKFIDETVRRRG